MARFDKSIGLGFLLGLAWLYLGVLTYGPAVAGDACALSPSAVAQSQSLKSQVLDDIYASSDCYAGLMHSTAVSDPRRVLVQDFSLLPAAFAPKVSSYILNSVFNL
jgi:hypothetical protein